MDHDLLLDVVIYLGAAVVCVPLARRLNLGSVLGYLAAGCLIGPHCFGFIKSVESVLHLSEFGVVLMLFAIGLELDLRKLWGMRRAVFGGGALQMLACGAVIALGVLALGLTWQAAVVVGLSLALSSTAIAVQTMKERNLLGSPLGQASFAILLFQDIAAIPLIGIVPLLSTTSTSSGGGLLAVGKVLGAILAVIVIGRYLTRPVLRIVAGTHAREVFTSFALLLVAGIAYLMQLAGVSMALGAFLAGVLLASSEYRHALETDLEPFKGLLLGLFFIAVGMSIDFGLFARSPLLILGLVVGLLAAKILVLSLIARPLGVDSRQRWLFAALLSQGGEFAFVVLGVAQGSHVLRGAWDGIFTLVVALSMAVTPLLLLIHDFLAARSAREYKREADRIEPEGAKVIIAGFGRFGQIVARLLLATGAKVTVLDHDAEQIELLRRFGFRVFYGDATRVDLLEAAGAADAKVLINAIDGVEDSLALVDNVREHFPKLRIIARARNVTHFYELRRRGVELLERETFEAALLVGRRALEVLGCGAYEAKELADNFRRYNLRMLESVLPQFEDEKLRLSAAKAAREELEEQFQNDLAERERPGTTGWHREAS
jgi:glutathione-regulated potassium-efflux system ancillary protein KefC